MPEKESRFLDDSLSNSRWRFGGLEWAVLWFVAAAVVHRLFVPPIVGTADNTFYMEAASLVFALLALACGLDMATSARPRLWKLAGFFAAVTAAAVCEWRREYRSDGRPGVLPAFVCTVLAMAAGQFFVVVITGGESDIEKHLLLFDLFFDASLIAALMWVATRLVTGWHRLMAIFEVRPVRRGAA